MLPLATAIEHRRLPPHGLLPRRSCLRLVLRLRGYIWYSVLLLNSRFRTGDFHPMSSRPCRAYRHASASITRRRKNRGVLGRGSRASLTQGDTNARKTRLRLPGATMYNRFAVRNRVIPHEMRNSKTRERRCIAIRLARELGSCRTSDARFLGK